MNSQNNQNSSDDQTCNKILKPANFNNKRRLVTKKLRSFGSFAGFIIAVVAMSLLINKFIFQSYYVDGTSMTPTLQNEDRLIIEKVDKTIAAIQGKDFLPNRGDIIVLDSTILDSYGRNEQLIKRVIGLPGDTISISNGVVKITNIHNPNGFDANKSLKLNLEPTYSSTELTVLVPNNQIFVMGDNRSPGGSFDSRSFGTVKTNTIKGKLWARIFPLSSARIY